MKEFLEFLVKSIVTNEDAVTVEVGENYDGSVNLKLHVDPSEMGLVIGKEGKNIKSLRNLIKAKAIKDGVRVNVELAEDPNSKFQDPAETKE